MKKKTFEEWYTDVFGGHITKSQATDELDVAYQYYCNVVQLKNENEKLKFLASLQRGNKGVCLEIDGKDMTDVYNLQQQLNEKDIIISFLKKELAHKMSYRQVMKRQYRKLRQQMDSDNERHTKAYADLVIENARLKHIVQHDCIEWHDMEKNPNDFPPKDPEHCGFSITVITDDGGTAYANLEQERWCTSRPIKAWFKIPHYLTFKCNGVVWFNCEKCGKSAEIEIKISDYDTEKDKQFCECGGKMNRVIEWQGWAKASGEG